MRALSRHRSARLALSALLVLATAGVRAQTGDEWLLLDVCVNQRCIGVAAVTVRGERILVDRNALAAAGLDDPGIAGEQIGEHVFVAVDAINPHARTVLDREQLRLDVTVPPSRLPVQHVALQPRAAPPQGDAQPWSAFVNYAVSVGEDAFDRSVYLDGAIGRGHAALRSTALWGHADGWQRGLTRLEVDQPQHLRRWTAGDQFAIARDPLGGGALLAGFGVERVFEQDPSLVTVPQPSYQGVLETPGTVEVYANGVLVARRDLAAGPFTFEGLGIPSGRNDVKVIVRDPFGNRSELPSRSYYVTSTLLARGLSDYAVRIGVPREAGSFDGDYADAPALQAWYRRGLNDRVTLGGRIEGHEGLTNIGVDAALLSGFGEFNLAVSASDEETAGQGTAVAFNYGYTAPGWGLGVGTRRFDAAYRNLGQPFDLAAGRFLTEDYVTVSLTPMPRLSLQFHAGHQRREDLLDERYAGVSGSWRLSQRAQLLFIAERRERRSTHDTIAMLSFNYALDRDNLTVSARRNGDASSYGLDLQRSRPAGVGWGYDLSLQDAEAFESGFAQAEYQGPHGRYALQGERTGDQTSGRMLASGALVGIGGRVFATPPVESGFALVRVPGLADTPILRENLDIGRTDAQGDLLVTGMIPYYPNKIALDSTRVPLGHELIIAQREVAVPRNTGAVVALEVRQLHAVTGLLRVRGPTGSDAVVYGRLRLQGEAGRFESLIGSEGRFYFDDLPAGEYTATIESQDQRAQCMIQVPAAALPGTRNLGEVICAAVATMEQDK